MRRIGRKGWRVIETVCKRERAREIERKRERLVSKLRWCLHFDITQIHHKGRNTTPLIHLCHHSGRVHNQWESLQFLSWWFNSVLLSEVCDKLREAVVPLYKQNNTHTQSPLVEFPVHVFIRWFPYTLWNGSSGCLPAHNTGCPKKQEPKDICWADTVCLSEYVELIQFIDLTTFRKLS